jgi:hypothetical protein
MDTCLKIKVHWVKEKALGSGILHDTLLLKRFAQELGLCMHTSNPATLVAEARE